MDVCKFLIKTGVLLTSLPVRGQPTFLERYGDLDDAKVRVERLENDHNKNCCTLAELAQI